jgi:2'-5' RNA ligase
MSFIGLRLPTDTARVLSTIDVPGKREAPGFFHVTLHYLGKDLPIETIAKAIPVIYGVAQETAPFVLRTSLVTCFDDHGDGFPVHCQVESPGLHALHAALKEGLKANGIPFSDKWPEYKPHMTLSYAPERIEDRAIPPVEWGASEVVFWGGDEGDQRISVNFPFTLSLAQRIARRFQRLP